VFSRIASSILLFVCVSAAGETRYLRAIPNATSAMQPKAGWQKVGLGYWHPLPNASSPAQVATVVPIDVRESYYDDRLWIVNAVAQHVPLLRALLGPQGISVTDYDYLDTFDTPAGRIDTRLGITVPRNHRADAVYGPGERGPYVVQFHGPSKPEWHDLLGELGVIRNFGFLGSATLLVSATPEMMAQVRELPFVQWSEPWHPYLKSDIVPAADPATPIIVYGALANVPGAAETLALAHSMGANAAQCYRADFCGSISHADLERLLEERAVIEIRAHAGLMLGPTPPVTPPTTPPSVPPAAPIPALSTYATIALAAALATIAVRCR
jgi:hypothetical protein